MAKVNYFFVDEAGDPVFYNKYKRLIVGENGCSKILLLGFIKTHNPRLLRKEILKLQQEIIKDKYYVGVPSISKTARMFHAKDDIPEVREKVFKLIRKLDFRADFVVARKNEKIFIDHHFKEYIFYSDLVIKLFENKFNNRIKNIIYFSSRANITRSHLIKAIEDAKGKYESKHNIKLNVKVKVFSQKTEFEPCLQIADYMNWAVQRAYIRSEDRYIKFMKEKVNFLWDIYDINKFPLNYYSYGNKFHIKKISPL